MQSYSRIFKTIQRYSKKGMRALREFIHLEFGGFVYFHILIFVRTPQIRYFIYLFGSDHQRVSFMFLYLAISWTHQIDVFYLFIYRRPEDAVLHLFICDAICKHSLYFIYFIYSFLDPHYGPARGLAWLTSEMAFYLFSFWSLRPVCFQIS